MGLKRHDSKSLNILSRRDFIRQSTLGILGLSFSGGLASGTPSLLGNETGAKSKLILARHSKAVDDAGKIQQPLLQEMVDKAITTFTGKNSLKDSLISE